MNTRMNKFGVGLTVPSLVLGLIGLSACSMLAPPTTRSGDSRCKDPGRAGASNSDGRDRRRSSMGQSQDAPCENRFP